MSTITALPQRRLYLYPLMFLIAALILSGCRVSPGATPDDGPEPAVSEQASEAVIDRVAEVVQTVKRGEDFTISATQDEVTSFLVYGSDVLGHYMDAYDAGATPETRQIPGMETYVTDAQWDTTMEMLRDSQNRATTLLKELRDNIREPRVYFTAGGRLVLHGTADLAGAQAPLRIVLVPEVQDDGFYRLRYEEAQLGGLDAPSWVGTLVEEAMDRAIRIGERDVLITAIDIEAGEATVSGTVRQ